MSIPSRVSPVVLKKSLDADFHSIMKSVNFAEPPREVITIKQMQAHYNREKNMGRDVYE